MATTEAKMDGTQSYDVAADSTCRLLLVSLLIYRIAYLTTAPVDLIHDEAYYWDWSRNLDWCYYSKPPGIAWLIALSTWLGGSTPFFVRLPAAILSVGTVAFSYLLGSRIYDRKVGLAVAALVAFSPANAAMGVVMTIDAPFLCCWSAALYCLWRMLERGTDRWQWAIMTMLSVGTGLLFKQTMIAFPALAGTFVLLHKSDRHEWRSISFWFAGLGSLLFLTPVVWWNSRNNWIMLGHTRAHFDGAPQTIIDRLYGCAEFVISQAGMISPLTYLCMSFVAFAGCLSRRKLEHKERFLLWFWIGPIMATLGLSLTQRVEANWPAPFYATAFVLLAAVALGRTPISMPHWTLHRSLAVGATCVAITYALPFLLATTNTKGSPVDLVVRMWGWQELGTQVAAKVNRELGVDERKRVKHIDTSIEQHASDGLASKPAITSKVNWLVTIDRAIASELAFYLPSQPHVFLWNGDEHVTSQYDLWGVPSSALKARDTVLVCRAEPPPELAKTFERIEELGEVQVPISDRRSHQLRLWRASGYRMPIATVPKLMR